MVLLAGVMLSDCATALLTVSVAVAVVLPVAAVMVTCPALTVLATPWLPLALLMVARLVSDEVQVTVVVRSCVLLSEYVPVALNACCTPAGTVVDAGVTAIDLSVAAVTDSVAVPDTLPEAAVMVALPTLAPVATPAALIDATAVLLELQLTEPVMSCVLLSEYVPVALNGCVVPLAIEAVDGDTVMPFKVAPVTVTVVEPATALRVPALLTDAVMVDEPCDTDFTAPWLPLLLLTVALLVSDDDQLACVVRSCVVLSLKVPVAFICTLLPSGIDGVDGVTDTVLSVAFVTVSTVVPLTPLSVAEMLLLPGVVVAVARPLLPAALLMVAAEVLLDAQVTLVVISRLELSLYIPVALYCRLKPAASLLLAGVTWIADRLAALTVAAVAPVTPW